MQDNFELRNYFLARSGETPVDPPPKRAVRWHVKSFGVPTGISFVEQPGISCWTAR